MHCAVYLPLELCVVSHWQNCATSTGTYSVFLLSRANCHVACCCTTLQDNSGDCVHHAFLTYKWNVVNSCVTSFLAPSFDFWGKIHVGRHQNQAPTLSMTVWWFIDTPEYHHSWLATGGSGASLCPNNDEQLLQECDWRLSCKDVTVPGFGVATCGRTTGATGAPCQICPSSP